VDVYAFKKLIGKDVPELPVMNLKSGEHSTLRSYIEQGKAAVIVFWSTWCCGCPDSLDVIEKMAAKEFKDKVNFIAINTNGTELPKMEFERWAHMSHLFVNEENKTKVVRGDFGLKFLPHCTVVDQNGVVVQNGGNFYVDRVSIHKELSRLVAAA